MTTKYINGSGLAKVLQLISNTISSAINNISGRVSNIEKDYANAISVNYDELVYMRDSRTLSPGQYYRILDYVTTTSQEGTTATNYTFEILVLATDYNKLHEEAIVPEHPAWKIWYCLDNNTSRFAWAGATKTILNVNCVFTAEYENGSLDTSIGDFRRDESLVIEESDITYYGYTCASIIGSSTPLFNTDTVLWYTEEFPEFTDDRVPHTFYQISDGEMIPINLSSYFYGEEEKIGKGVIYRMIDEHGNDCPYDFKSIMFKNPNDETDDKYYYTFYYEDSNDGIVDSSTDYRLKTQCYNNVIKHYKKDDTMYIPNNIFRLYLNKGGHCYNNTFGNGCYNNTFDGGCHDNTFGNNCHDNTFGNKCYDNTFGNNCYDNSFIYVNSGDSSQTEILNGIVNCDFSNEYQYNQLKHLKESNTSNTSHYLKNVHFCKGIKGYIKGNNITYNTIAIEGTLPDNIETKVAKNSKGELKIYCEADLIA